MGRDLRHRKTSSGGGGGAGSIILDKDYPVVLSGTKSLGRYQNGSTIPSTGWTLDQFITDITTEYLQPAFSFFDIGIPQSQEIGTTFNGNYNAAWVTTNSSNVSTSPTAIEIFFGTTSGTLLATSSNDGVQTISHNFTVTSGTRTYTIRGINDKVVPDYFTATDTIVGYYKQFFGSSATAPTVSADVRALPSSNFANVNSFTLVTGTTHTNFTFAIPATKNLVSVVDTTNSNATITSSYILQGLNQVADASGTLVAYKVYTLTTAVPYATSANHVITVI